MHTIIDAAFSRSRTVLLLLGFVLISGALAYVSIPKEAEPDVPIPFVNIHLAHDGISPEDAERLLVRPMERELQGITGLKELQAQAAEGYASLTLEFFAGFNNQQALADVRQKVDTAKSKLPDATEEPVITEINVALFPVLTVALSGSVPERTLVRLARDLKDQLETLPGVLEADIGGDREPLMELIVEPAVIETYEVDFSELFRLVGSNNRLVAAGTLDTGAGRLAIKVPGLIEQSADLYDLPVKIADQQVVTLGEVAEVRYGFMDPEGFARVNGQLAVTLEIKKRVGANIIDTIEAVRETVLAEQQHWPQGIQVNFMQDKSQEVRTILADLQNNVLSAVILVMIVILAALGPRSAILVGVAIPGAFLAGILALDALGYTLNIVVLFSLILVVGMLVDGAIVVVELADRDLRHGQPPSVAYAGAAKRMAWPITASTLTTLSVFVPLLFWPGIVGEFMKYLPITVLLTLIAALAMALVFVPVLGAQLSTRSMPPVASPSIASEIPPPDSALTALYLRVLSHAVHRPGWVLVIAIVALLAAYFTYGVFGRGVEFFPEVEPEMALLQIHARGDLSIDEKDALVRAIENEVVGHPELQSVYARSFNAALGPDQAEDLIGLLQLELIDWDQRRRADALLSELRQRTAVVPGVRIELRKAQDGPAAGKPIQIELSARDPARIAPAVAQVRALMDQLGGFVDIEDNRPLPGIEWRIEVDRERAARHGADIALIGQAVQLVTTGIKVSDYRPDDADDEVDIRARFPRESRTLDQLDRLRVTTAAGQAPISQFVQLIPAPKTGTLTRVDGRRVLRIQADVAPGQLADAQLQRLRTALAAASAKLDPEVSLTFKGEDADQREAADFLLGSFLTAIFTMGLILVTQFNSLRQALIVLSAIVFSTAGVLLGLLIAGQTFGIVMVGLGIIALAGIVVNNNIVLIDSFNHLTASGLSAIEAAIETGRQRLRPVLLTAVTTVLGLLPMVLAMNIDLLARDISFGAPSTQWWTQLASAIAGGLTFATGLTLLLTPCLLVLGRKKTNE